MNFAMGFGIITVIHANGITAMSNVIFWGIDNSLRPSLVFFSLSDQKNGAINCHGPVTIDGSAENNHTLKDLKNERGEWGEGLKFLMACISTSVGFGNIWRFPVTAYENGGGAFLIPYIIVLLFVGKPFYFLEALLGQFTSKSCVKTWAMAPAMKGLGYAQAFAALCVVSYYCSLMALTVYYFFASFQSQLPWTICLPEWANLCVVSGAENTFENGVTQKDLRSSAELYFRRTVLNEKDSIEDGIGLPSWQLCLCLLLSWISVFLVLCRGIESTGKAVYFLALFPYVVMIILLIRAVTLEGAVNGILFFVTPKWDLLLEPTVWYAAITQCFFSLSVCFGPILTYSSFNNFNHKISRDVLVVTTIDTFTSFMAGCTIFGILGNLAHEIGSEDLSKVVRGGTALAFVSYPEALGHFQTIPQLFAVIFFFMMFVLGIGSAVSYCACIFAILNDYMPNVKQWQLVLPISVIGYCCSLTYVTPGGQWFVTLVDYYGATFVAIIVAVLEIITISWIYGLWNFLNDVEFMLGSRPGLYWRTSWLLLTPLLTFIVLLYTFFTYKAPTYDNIQFPLYAYGIGWCLFALGVLQIVGWMIQELIRNKSSNIVQVCKAAFRPCKEKWGPADPNVRARWEEFVAKKNLEYQGTLRELFFN